jgi:hypothetical protein
MMRLSMLLSLRAVDELDEDEAYLRLLDAKKAQLSSKDDSSGIINMDEWTDDEETESALDAHDPFGMLVLTMNAMQTSHPQRFQVCVDQQTYIKFHSAQLQRCCSASCWGGGMGRWLRCALHCCKGGFTVRTEFRPA